MSNFKDLFSTQAAEYSKYRPHYPQALFSYLAKNSRHRELAWDAGTGNGQAALALTPHFSKVIATDPSSAQLKEATLHPQVEYRVAKAEESGLPDYSVSLITVAQAFHWFEQEAFFREVRRVSEPEGLLALWCYELAVVNDGVDSAVFQLYKQILGPHWDERRKLVEEGYRKEKIPFNELEPPTFAMEADWSLNDFVGYLQTWSAVQKYQKQTGKNPLSLVSDEIKTAWGNPDEKLKVSWPLSLRVFQIV